MELFENEQQAGNANVSAGELLALPQFTTAQIATATGVPAETIRTWFKRDILSIAEEGIGRPAEAKGLGRLFSGNMAMMVAIMGRLTLGKEGGIIAESAKKAAHRFVMAGADGRQPGLLFPTGETVLVVSKDGSAPGARVINVLAGDQPTTWLDLINIAGPSASQFEILMLDELWQSVFQRLGIRAALEREAG